MPISPDKLASAAACLRKFARDVRNGAPKLAGTQELTAGRTVSKIYKDRVPEGGAYPCLRSQIVIPPDADVWAQRRGSRGYVETNARLLIACHSDNPDDDVFLAAAYSEIRYRYDNEKIVQYARSLLTNDFGVIVQCLPSDDWEPAIASLDTTAKEFSATGIWFDVILQRARLS